MKNRMNMMAWSKTQLEERKQKMEELHPGYYAMNIRMQVFLGTVFMIRFIYLALVVILGGQLASLLSILGLFFGLCLYYAMLQYDLKIYRLFLIIRLFEMTELASVLSDIFQLNFLGVLLYVFMTFAMLIDVGFLLYVTFSKKVREMMKNNRLVHSDQRLTLRVSPEEMGITEE